MPDAKETLIIGICDNEIYDLKLVHNTLEEQILKLQPSIRFEIHPYTNGEALLKSAEKTAFKLLILDIEMPGYSGFELAHKIQMLHPEIRIVFVSNHESYVYDSFDYTPLRFVRKKYLAADLEKALQKYIKLTARKRIIYKLSDKYSSRDLLLSDIRYFECNAHNIKIVTKEQIYHTYGSLKLIEKELIQNDFVRVHKNYLLNQKYIGHVWSRDIELLDGTKLPMGRGRKKMIQEVLSTYDRSFS